jgi:hypothetical protein
LNNKVKEDEIFSECSTHVEEEIEEEEREECI